MAQKFKKQPGEVVRKKGNLFYSVGEPGFKNFITGKYRSTECTVYLTNQRFVATKARQYFPLGPAIWLIRALFFSRTVVFSFPLDQLAAIKLDSAQRNAAVLATTTGQEFKVYSASLLNKMPKWLVAIRDAVTEAAPGTTVEETESAITFRNSTKSNVATRREPIGASR